MRLPPSRQVAPGGSSVTRDSATGAFSPSQASSIRPTIPSSVALFMMFPVTAATPSAVADVRGGVDLRGVEHVVRVVVDADIDAQTAARTALPASRFGADFDQR